MMMMIRWLCLLLKYMLGIYVLCMCVCVRSPFTNVASTFGIIVVVVVVAFGRFVQFNIVDCTLLDHLNH